jgi:hypothetical protein
MCAADMLLLFSVQRDDLRGEAIEAGLVEAALKVAQTYKVP